MIAPFIIAAAAAPVIIALWLVTWLFGDLFAGLGTATVPVPSGGRPRRPASSSEGSSRCPPSGTTIVGIVRAPF